MADNKLRICVLICLISIISSSSIVPSATTFVSPNIPDPSGKLSSTYYETRCPGALAIIKAAINKAILIDPRWGASLLRLHFHDCFVQGCDASVLLRDTPNFKGEQNALPNANSLRGYEIIENIKALLEIRCANVVSCADILAVAARDSVVALGGPFWLVQLGRRDSTTANLKAANSDLPSPFLDLKDLIAAFENKGFSAEEMVALSGAHTIGKSKCSAFRARIYNESNVDIDYRKSLKENCPSTGGDNNLSSLDTTTPNIFDNAFYKDLLYYKGLLHSDQQLYNGSYGSTDYKVSAYAKDQALFSLDFANAMIKMGNLSPLTGYKGQIRKYCSSVNYV